MTLPRLWVFLAVALPVAGHAHRAASPSVDLTYHLRAGAEILDGGGDPDRRHLDVHGGRRCRGSTSSGAPQVDPRRGLPRRPAGPVSSCSGRCSSASSSAAVLRSAGGAGLGARRAALLTLGGVPHRRRSPSGLRPQLSGWRSSRSSCCSSPIGARTRGRLWAIPLARARCGPTSTAASSSGRSCSGSPGSRTSTTTCRSRTGSLVVAIVSALAACVTPFGPAVWVYAVGLSTNPAVTARITEWQPTSLRTPARASLFFGSAWPSSRSSPGAAAPTPWPTLAWLAVFFLIGVYAVARRRLVAARGGRRDRRRRS